MTVSQISVFAQSKPGYLARVLQIFDEAQVNVRGYSVSDTGEFGITRYIVDDTNKACAALKDKGCACVVSDVICIKLHDTPGNLARVMNVFANLQLNISYSYSMISTYIIVASPNLLEAENELVSAGFEVVSQDKLSQIIPFNSLEA